MHRAVWQRDHQRWVEPIYMDVPAATAILPAIVSGILQSYRIALAFTQADATTNDPGKLSDWGGCAAAGSRTTLW